jgi:hypothetical protein
LALATSLRKTAPSVTQGCKIISTQPHNHDSAVFAPSSMGFHPLGLLFETRTVSMLRKSWLPAQQTRI